MMLFLGQAVSLLIPLVFSGLLLVLCIKKKWLTQLDTPLDRGVTWRGKPLFGRNKTFRGLLVHSVGAVSATILLWLLQPSMEWIAPLYASNPIVLGIVFALAYSAGELMNSFVKRRLNVSPGSRTEWSHTSRRLQHFFDTSDGIIVVGVVLWAVYQVPWQLALTAVILACGVHLLIDLLMQSLGLKKAK